MGLLMAGGTLVRRMRRANRYGDDFRLLNAVKKSDDGTALAIRARTTAVAAATATGSVVGLATLAVSEQAGARLVSAGVNAMAGRTSGSSASSSATGSCSRA